MPRRQTADVELKTLADLTTDNPLQHGRAVALQESVHQQFALLDRHLATRDQGSLSSDQTALLAAEGSASQTHTQQELDTMTSTERDLLAARTASSQASLHRTLLTLGIASAVAMAMVVIVYLLSLRDERVRARIGSQLRAGEDRKAAILDAVLDSIVGMDGTGRIVEWNTAAERSFGYTRKQALGRDMADLIIPGGYRDAHRKGLAYYLQTGKGPVIGQRIELSAIRADGSEFPIELAITALPSDQGPLFTGYIRDITERRRADHAMRASEERSRLLLESTGEGIYGVNVAGDCIFANKACAKLLGYDDPQQLIGKPTHELFHHTHADGTPYPRQTCPIYKTGQSGKGIQVDDEVFWRRDGTSFFVEYRASPIMDEGQTIGVVAAFVDITARRQAEQGMRLRESALRSIGQGVFITDPGRSDEPIVFVNAAFEHLTGYKRREVKGREIDYLTGPDTDPDVARRMREAMNEGREHVAELLLYRKDGTPFWATVSLAPVAGADKSMTHFVGVVTDVTERRRAEEELKRAKEQAEEK